MAKRSMKDSGVEWIGKIPSCWDLKRLKLILNERNEKNDPIKTDNILSLGLNYGVIPYSEREISGGNKAKEDLSAYKLTYPNDIVMNSMNVISGSVGISNYYGCVSPVYYMFYPRNDSFNIRYYNMMFQSKAFQRSLLGLGNGIMMKENDEGNFNTVRMRIPIIKLNNLLLPIPPKDEQARIVNFLDKKVSEIDAAISKTKESIEEYKKLKQSIITETVTKGLNPNVEMKDSGVKWIGKVPYNWRLTKFKFTYDLSNTGESVDKDYYSETEGDIIFYMAGSAPVKTTYNSFPDWKYTTKNDLLMARNGTPYVYLPKERAAYSDHVIRTRIIDSFCKSFVSYALQQSIYSEIVETVSIPTWSISLWNKQVLPMPGKDTQEQIANYLDERCSRLDSLISKKEQVITELEQYKKSMIYEYVTGKKEIPND